MGEHRAFHVPSGGMVCVHCRPQGCAVLSPGVPAHLSALLEGRWDAVAASSPAVVRQSSALAAAHLHWHLERELRSLPLVDRGHPRVDVALTDRQPPVPTEKESPHARHAEVS